MRKITLIPVKSVWDSLCHMCRVRASNGLSALRKYLGHAKAPQHAVYKSEDAYVKLQRRYSNGFQGGMSAFTPFTRQRSKQRFKICDCGVSLLSRSRASVWVRCNFEIPINRQFVAKKGENCRFSSPISPVNFGCFVTPERSYTGNAIFRSIFDSISSLDFSSFLSTAHWNSSFYVTI